MLEKTNPFLFKAIPHNSKCRYGERGAAAARPKAQIILDAAKVSAASGGNSEPKQGQRSQSARGFGASIAQLYYYFQATLYHFSATFPQ